MTTMPLQPAEKPTMYFIGVTTRKSSIMKVFPRWADFLELGDCQLRGIDLQLHDDPARYREVVQFIKEDPLSRGALVTTHKLDLLRAARDLFDTLDPLASLLGEISSISKRDGNLIGHAKDPVTSGLAAEAFLPENHWVESDAEACLLGAGGSALAFSHYLTLPEHGANRPSRILVTERNRARLDEMRRFHDQLAHGLSVVCCPAPDAAANSSIVNALKPGSLVVNATGLGKDGPGSPLDDAARFPGRGFAWEFNYRGELRFLEQARRQQEARKLTVEDGWIYFIHGWTRVIAEVFEVEIPTAGPRFDALSKLASPDQS